MSFIAGYCGETRKYDSAWLEEQVRSYSILPGENCEGYDTQVIETKFGHLIHKRKTNYPIYTPPFKDADGNLLVSLGFIHKSGTLYNNERLATTCVDQSPNALEQCEGEFVAIFADGRSGALHIVNDRFASRPFYLLPHDGLIYFSSNLAFLLYLVRAKHEIDVIGWMQIFSLGHTCGSRTHLRDVKRLHPASHLVISPDGKVNERRYWRLEHQPEEDLDPVAHSKKVFEAFQSAAAMRARMGGRGVIALSGGLDSRLVAAAIPRDLDYSAFTFVNSAERSTTKETEAAAAVCKALRLQHHVREVPIQGFSRVAADVIKLTGGLRPLHHMAIVMLYIQEIKEKEMNFMLGGGPGDVLAGSYVPTAEYLDPERLESCIKDSCNQRLSASNGLRFLFKDEVLREHSPAFRDTLTESFQSLSGPTAAQRVTAWAMVYRQPAFTFTSLIHTHPDVAEAFCHLDYQYCDLMLRLPAAWLYDENFYSFMIYSSLPELRHVPYANTGELLSGALKEFEYREPWSERMKAIVQHRARAFIAQNSVARNLVALIRPKPRSMSFYRTLLGKDEQLLSQIEQCLRSYNRLGELLDVNKCLKLLDAFKNGSSVGIVRDIEFIGSLATLCLTFRDLDI